MPKFIFVGGGEGTNFVNLSPTSLLGRFLCLEAQNDSWTIVKVLKERFFSKFHLGLGRREKKQ